MIFHDNVALLLCDMTLRGLAEIDCKERALRARVILDMAGPEYKTDMGWRYLQKLLET